VWEAAAADAGGGRGLILFRCGTRGEAGRGQGWIGFPFAWATDSVPKAMTPRAHTVKRSKTGIWHGQDRISFRRHSDSWLVYATLTLILSKNICRQFNCPKRNANS
jgi:hypothetical protein